MQTLIVPPLVRIVDFDNVSVIRGPQEVEFGHVVGITELLDDAPLLPGAAVRDVGVAVEVSPDERIGFTVMRPLMPLPGGAFGGGLRRGEGLIVGNFCRERG